MAIHLTYFVQLISFEVISDIIIAHYSFSFPFRNNYYNNNYFLRSRKFSIVSEGIVDSRSCYVIAFYQNGTRDSSSRAIVRSALRIATFHIQMLYSNFHSNLSVARCLKIASNFLGSVIHVVSTTISNLLVGTY